MIADIPLMACAMPVHLKDAFTALIVVRAVHFTGFGNPPFTFTCRAGDFDPSRFVVFVE